MMSLSSHDHHQFRLPGRMSKKVALSDAHKVYQRRGSVKLSIYRFRYAQTHVLCSPAFNPHGLMV